MALRRRFAFPANRISLIVNEKRSVTADTALRLARFFGTSAEYWLSIQNRYDLARLDRDRIQREVLQRVGA